jgi:hypothetical protein
MRAQSCQTISAVSVGAVAVATPKTAKRATLPSSAGAPGDGERPEQQHAERADRDHREREREPLGGDPEIASDVRERQRDQHAAVAFEEDREPEEGEETAMRAVHVPC